MKLKNIKLIVIIIVLIFILPMLFIDLPRGINEYKQKNEALKYFYNKYANIDRDKLVVKYTTYAKHDKDDFCINGCEDINVTYITYDGSDYKIKYNFDKGIWTDNYEQKVLENDYKRFIKNKFPGFNVTESSFEFVVERNNIKYNGNIDEYIKQADLSLFWPKILYDVDKENAEKVKNDTIDELLNYLSQNHVSYDIIYTSTKINLPADEKGPYYKYHVYENNRILYDGINKKNIQF